MPASQPEEWFLSERKTQLRPAFTSGNMVRPLIDGEIYFSSLNREIERLGPDGRMHFAGWRVSMQASLVPADTPGESFEDVLRTKLQQGVKIRALLWNIPGTSNDFSAGHGSENLYAFTMLSQSSGGACVLDDRLPHGNFASHHQKYMLLSDGNRSTAFIGGLDIALDRWDSSTHDDPSARDDQMEQFHAWHDVQALVRGPAVEQLWQSFLERWSDPRSPNDLIPHDSIPDISSESPTTQTNAGNQHVQLLRTYACKGFAFPFSNPMAVASNPSYPFAPAGEYTYRDGLVRAVNRAEEFIYIEDQYFWPCDVVEALADAVARGVTLILVLQRTYDVEGLAPYHNFMREMALNTIRDRASHLAQPPVYVYHLLQHREVGQVEGEEIYVHSKTVIIDDCYAVIGSANINARSMTTDSEIGIAVVDGVLEPGEIRGNSYELCRFARTYRMALWQEHLSRTIEDPLAADGSPNGFPTDPAVPAGHVHVHEVSKPQWCSPSFVRAALMNPNFRCNG